MSDLAYKAKKLFSFPSPKRGEEKIIELRALTHGLPPKKVKQNLELFFEEWKSNGVDAWNHMNESAEVFLVGDEPEDEKQKKFGWWVLPEVIGDRFISRLLHAPQGSCIMMQNASQIIFSLLSCRELNKPGRRKIICTDGEFPSVLHGLHHFNRQFENHSEDVRKKVEFDICIVEIGSEPFNEEKILTEINEQTAVVLLSHVGFTRGERIPDKMIQKIVKTAHKHGALVILDGYHAVGNYTIHVNELGVDAYLGGLLKEGCGSSGNCFLYIRPGLDLTPSISGWFGDKHPFLFDAKPEINPNIRRRFLTGTTPIAPFYHGLEGLKIMLKIGLKTVEKDILSKVDFLAEFFLAQGIKVISPLERERMSSLMVLSIPEANKFRDFIIEKHGVMVDARKNQFIRLAPHIYNSLSELKEAAKVITKAYTEKNYLNYSSKEKNGPVT